MVVALVVVAACGGSSSTSSGTAAPLRLEDLRGKASNGHTGTVLVTVGDNHFDPKAIRIDVGVTVAWHNSGRLLHDIERADTRVAFPGAPQPFGVDQFSVGTDYSFTFTAPGVYRYYCSFHGSPSSGMFVVVVVGAVPFASANISPSR